MTIQHSRCRTCSSQEQAFRDQKRHSDVCESSIQRSPGSVYDRKNPTMLCFTRVLSLYVKRIERENEQVQSDRRIEWRMTFHIVSTVISLMKFTVLDVLSRLNRDNGARFVEQITSDLLYRLKFSLRFIMYFSKRIYYYIIQIYILRKNSIEH